MKLPFKKEEFLGNIRSGNKRENNSPRNLNHFDVHLDNYTSNYSVELFKSLFKENPRELKIKPVLYKINYDIYKKEIKCLGEAGKATRITNNGQKTEIECKKTECEYYKSGKCTRTGKLYFRLSGIEDKGIWCYSTKSKGIDSINNYLKLKQEQGISIEDTYFLLELHEKNGRSGKIYVPDIKIIEENNNNGMQCKENSKDNSSNDIKLYVYVKREMAEYNNERMPKLTFKNKEGKEFPLFMLKDVKKDILHLEPGTVIGITKFKKDKDNTLFLQDYKIVKAIEKNKEENKKAV